MRGPLLAGAGALVALALVFSPAMAADEPSMLLSAIAPVVGAKYRIGAEGPTRFDCSGFVWFAFDSAGLGDRVGGKRGRARQYQNWLKAQAYTDPKLAVVGDLAFWGRPAVHVGIVTRVNHPGGKPGRVNVFVTSALTGVGVHEYRVDLITAAKPFSGYAHTGLTNVPDPTPTPTPTPLPTPTATPTPSSTLPVDTATPAPTSEPV